jgi:hypothetical protein
MPEATTIKSSHCPITNLVYRMYTIRDKGVDMRLNRNGFAAAQVVNFPFPKLSAVTWF